MTASITLPDGRTVDLDNDVVLGRAPVAPPQSPGARSISVSVQTVSKTHVLVGADATGVWIIDLGSSNGTELLTADGARRVDPGARVPVPPGHHIRIGTEAVVTVDHGATAADMDDTTIVRGALDPSIIPSQPGVDGAPLGERAPGVDWSAEPEPPPGRPEPPAVDPNPVAATPPVVPPPEPVVSDPESPRAAAGTGVETPPVPPSAPAAEATPAAPAAAATIDLGAAAQPGAVPPGAFPPGAAPGAQPPPPGSQPPPPGSQPPPPGSQPPPPGSQPPPPGSQPPPPGAFSAGAVAPGPGFGTPAQTTGSSSFGVGSVGALVLMLWSAVASAGIAGLFPDALLDFADGWLLRFFFLATRSDLELVEQFGVVAVPGWLTWIIYIGTGATFLLALISLITRGGIARRLVFLPVALCLFLDFGVFVGLLRTTFLGFTDLADTFLPGYLLPIFGVLLAQVGGRSKPYPPPPSPSVFYAQQQPPAPGAGGPPFGGAP